MEPTALTPSASGLVALTSGGAHSWIMINALRERFGDFPIIQEAGEPASVFWARRKRLLGLMTVASMQAARLPLKLTKRGTGARIQQLIDSHGLNPNPPEATYQQVSSINDEATRTCLQALQPKAVFVVSTRMIGRKTLRCVDAPFINYHSGINPAYRGMFGGYFALANGQPEHFGATLHLVDEGVDTGDILYQSQVTVSPDDNFHTYLWALAAGSRDVTVQAMEDALNGRLKPYAVDLPSKQYFAPTFGGYLWTGLSKGVW